MVQLVDVLVKRTPVQSAVRKVVEKVFKNKEKGDLSGHERERRKWDLVCRHTKVAADGVEEVDQREFASKVGQEDDFGTLPDLGVGD